MKKVCHLVRSLLPFTASFIRNQILYHKRYSPCVVYAEKKAGHFFDEISEQVDMYNPLNGGIDSLLYSKTRILSDRAQHQIEEYIKNASPQTLHVHFGVDCIVYSKVIERLKIPTCVSFYGYDCTSFPKRFWGLGKRLLRQRVFLNPSITYILAMSENMKQDLLILGCPEDKIRVHYYGSEIEPFYTTRKPKDKENLDLVIISGLYEKKGHLILLDAFTDLCNRTASKLHLHIVGEGPMRDSIRRKIVAEGLTNVTLYGKIKYGSDLHRRILNMADIFVHPSITASNGDKEGIPGSIVEAMASGLAVVSTYHGGIPQIIDHETTGLLVDEYDSASLATAMQRLIEDRALRLSMGQRAQQYSRENLDVSRKEVELEQIYDEMIG